HDVAAASPTSARGVKLGGRNGRLVPGPQPQRVREAAARRADKDVGLFQRMRAKIQQRSADRQADRFPRARLAEVWANNPRIRSQVRSLDPAHGWILAGNGWIGSLVATREGLFVVRERLLSIRTSLALRPAGARDLARHGIETVEQLEGALHGLE